MAIGGFNRKVEKMTQWSLLIVGILGGIVVGGISIDIGVWSVPKVFLSSILLFAIAGGALFFILKRIRAKREINSRRNRMHPMHYMKVSKDFLSPPVHRVKRGPDQ